MYNSIQIPSDCQPLMEICPSVANIPLPNMGFLSISTISSKAAGVTAAAAEGLGGGSVLKATVNGQGSGF